MPKITSSAEWLEQWQEIVNEEFGIEPDTVVLGEDLFLDFIRRIQEDAFDFVRDSMLEAETRFLESLSSRISEVVEQAVEQAEAAELERLVESGGEEV